MANLPESLYEDYHLMVNWSSDAGGSSSRAAPSIGSVCRWIKDLQFPASRDLALQNLANSRNSFNDLPLLLWSSSAPIATLLQEVIGVYPELTSPIFTQKTSTRAYNALLLFQCIAFHPETRARFLRAMMPHYFYPLMNTRHTDKPREYLRLGGLGVIAQLLKAPENGAAVRFLLDSDAVRSCLLCIEIGSVASKTVATFILHKILLTDEGLQYCCVLADRYFIIDSLLKQVLLELAAMDEPPQNLLQLVAGCYLRLSLKSRAREGLRRYIPVLLVDDTFAESFAEDPVASEYQKQLLQNLKNRGLN